MLLTEWHAWIDEVVADVTAMMRRRHVPRVRFKVVFPLNGRPGEYHIFRKKD